MKKSNKRYDKCSCGETNNIWDNITDAWQKNNVNHYEYQCECGRRNTVGIVIEKQSYRISG